MFEPIKRQISFEFCKNKRRLFKCANVDLITTPTSIPSSGFWQGTMQQSRYHRTPRRGRTARRCRYGVGQEGNREGTCDQLPGNRSKDCSDDSSKETSVEEVLDPVLDTKDVLINTNLNIQSGDTGNDKEAECDTHLTANHESRQVLSFTLEEEVADTLGHWVVSTVFRLELGSPEESNLHTFQETNTADKDNKEDDRDTIGKSPLSHGCLSLEESLKSDSKGIAQDSKGDDNTDPEEGNLGSRLVGLIGDNRLASKPVGAHLDEVREVHDTCEGKKEDTTSSWEREEIIVRRLMNVTDKIR